MTDDQNATPGPKKPFVDPHLTVYGSIKDIAERIGKTGAMDQGGKGNMTKTR
jgi:hypothetical protein